MYFGHRAKQQRNVAKFNLAKGRGLTIEAACAGNRLASDHRDNASGQLLGIPFSWLWSSRHTSCFLGTFGVYQQFDNRLRICLFTCRNARFVRDVAELVALLLIQRWGAFEHAVK